MNIKLLYTPLLLLIYYNIQREQERCSSLIELPDMINTSGVSYLLITCFF